MLTAQSKRRYRSKKRDLAAAATRARIVVACRELVANRGLVGATLAAVARRARVALPTVYAVFGGKSALLRAAVADIKRDIGLGAAFRAMLDSRDPVERLGLAARVTRVYSEIGGGVLDGLRFGAQGDARLSAIWSEVEQGRYVGQLRLVRAIARDSGLRPGLSARSAADQMWSLTAHDTYRLMVGARGWTPARFERWLAGALVELLLGRRRPSRRSGSNGKKGVSRDGPPGASDDWPYGRPLLADRAP